MPSGQRGKSILAVEVTNVSPHGFWLLIDENESFVSFKDFPWFREASIAELTNVKLPSAHHLHWPDLDVDLAVESIEHPENYPLVSQVHPAKPLRPMTVKESAAKYRSVRVGRRGSSRGRS
jgi:hypothetical protein